MERFWLRFIISFAPVCIWYAVIFFLSHQPQLPGPAGEAPQFVWFKTAHILVYAILTGTVFWAVRRTWEFFGRNLWQQSSLRLQLLLVVGFLTTVLALLDEWHQTFVPGREPTWRDVYIDLIGIVAVLWWLSRYNGEKKTRDVAQMARAHAWGA